MKNKNKKTQQKNKAKQNKNQQFEQFKNLIEKSQKKGNMDIPYHTYT